MVKEEERQPFGKQRFQSAPRVFSVELVKTRKVFGVTMLCKMPPSEGESREVVYSILI
jgi:hypothetical protein